MWCTEVTYRVSIKELYWFSLEQWFPNVARQDPLRDTPFFFLCQTLLPKWKSGFASWHTHSTYPRRRCLRFFCATLHLCEKVRLVKGRHRNICGGKFHHKSKLSDNVTRIDILHGVPHHLCKPRRGPQHTFGWRTAAPEQRELCCLFVKLSQQWRSQPLLDKQYQDPGTFSLFSAYWQIFIFRIPCKLFITVCLETPFLVLVVMNFVSHLSLMTLVSIRLAYNQRRVWRKGGRAPARECGLRFYFTSCAHAKWGRRVSGFYF